MMNNLRKLFAVLLIAMGLLMGSCGEDVNPDMADVRLKMKATSTLGALDPGGRVMEDHITFTQALLGVTEIELESVIDDYSDHDDDSDDDSDDESSDDSSDDYDDYDDSDYDIEFEGRFVVDLIEGTSTPDFGIADVIPGEYKEIEVRLEPILEGGNSIFIEFTYQVSPEEDPVTVQYSTSRDVEFEIERKSGIQLDGGVLNQVLILLDLDTFLGAINMADAEMDEDGIIRINEDSNTDIAAAIWTKLDHMMEAGEDHDGDDDFDEDDDDSDDDSHDD